MSEDMPLDTTTEARRNQAPINMVENGRITDTNVFPQKWRNNDIDFSRKIPDDYGIYTDLPINHQSQQGYNYYIKQGDNYYRVKYDDNNHTYRLVNPYESLTSGYHRPIRRDGNNGWEFHSDVGGRGGAGGRKGGNVDNVVFDAPADRLDIGNTGIDQAQIRRYQDDIAYGNYYAAGIRHNFVRGRNNLPGYTSAPDASLIQKSTAKSSLSDLVRHHLQAVENLPSYKGGNALYRGSSISKENFDLLQKGKNVQAQQIGFFSESKLVARSFADGDGATKVNLIWRIQEPPGGVFKSGKKNGAHYGNIASDFDRRGIKDKGPIKIGDSAEVLVQPGSLFEVVSVKEEVIRHNGSSRVVYKVDLKYVRHDNKVHGFSLEKGNISNEDITPGRNTSVRQSGVREEEAFESDIKGLKKDLKLTSLDDLQGEVLAKQVGKEEVFTLNIKEDGNGVDNGAPPPPPLLPPQPATSVVSPLQLRLGSSSTSGADRQLTLGRQSPTKPADMLPDRATEIQSLAARPDAKTSKPSTITATETKYYNDSISFHEWNDLKKRGQQKYDEFYTSQGNSVPPGTTVRYESRYEQADHGAKPVPFINHEGSVSEIPGKHINVNVKSALEPDYQFRVSDNGEVLVVDNMWGAHDKGRGKVGDVDTLPMNELQGEFIKKNSMLQQNIKYITQETIANEKTQGVLNLILSPLEWSRQGSKPLVLKPSDDAFKVMLTTPNIQPTARMLSTYPDFGKKIIEIRIQKYDRITVELGPRSRVRRSVAELEPTWRITLVLGSVRKVMSQTPHGASQ
ncbi:hypothetical protein LZV00_11110 [Pseudomonas kielensis]|uniref:hypothetical protein n=1 Tax=Pseudomonas kielensis TaxID=2762577 RepID=UPI00224002F5|nr:hypothetical protein [Pseudomonas kielensis]UZM16214.1 hypothetical protein LZV00_11110 [Pseudomonas kielensis]